jgi:hypothetical protein
MLGGTMAVFSHLFAVACLVAGSLSQAAVAAESVAITTDFTAFQQDISPRVRAAQPMADRHWRQIEPALHHLAIEHADCLDTLSPDDQITALVALATFIDRVRAAHAARPVLAPGRTVIGLLDPARGLDPKEITAIATAYGGTPTVFKQDAAGETIASVADDFLAAVRAAAAADVPATIVVLGHGLPTEIQSYSIRFERLAAALLDGAARTDSAAAATTTVDLGHIVLVCDDCFSTDFLINLCTEIEAECRRRDQRLVSLPTCIAGTNRDCVGHADVGEKFVPHFWKDVIELFYVRRPRPETVTLGDFFEKVDNMMYGYGRTPMVGRDGSVSYRLVDPTQCQDPVVLVPLSAAELAALRTILRLPADAPLPSWLDIG